MTELEKIRRAKMYIDKLANGVNPLDDTPVPDAELINNVRLSRCFFFVSDILRQVIENDGNIVSVGKQAKILPLEISFEKRKQFAYSESPISASDIARRVNALIDQKNMRKLTYAGILTWLTEIGMMEWATTPKGTRTKRPTQSGMENGISVEERVGVNGSYQVVVYDRTAQQFLIDNLDAILVVENARTEMQGTPWTKEQDEYLVDFYKKSVPIDKIAATLKRSESAIRGRLRRLGLLP